MVYKYFVCARNFDKYHLIYANESEMNASTTNGWVDSVGTLSMVCVGVNLFTSSAFSVSTDEI